MPTPRLYPKNIWETPSIHVWADFNLAKSVEIKKYSPFEAPGKVTALKSNTIMMTYGNKAVNQTTWKWGEKISTEYNNNGLKS